MRPKNERRKPGEGPARLALAAGRGRLPRQDAGAGDWWLHDSIASVHRLRIITWLCTHPGEFRAREIAAALGVTYQAVQPHLIAMQWTMLAQGRWTPGHRTPRGGWMPDRRLWSVTQAGRRYLWRLGWVVGRLVPGVWSEDTWYDDARADPCAVLAQHASNAFLRPVQLAIAHLLWQFGPVTPRWLQDRLGIDARILRTSLLTWQAAGWAASTLITTPQYGVPPAGPLRAAKWRFTREGLQAMERHCHAVRWAAQNSGYIPPPDDRFLLGNDRAGWLTIKLEG